MPPTDDIVFEDLHGEPDQLSVEVDLDSDKSGIKRFSQADLPEDDDDAGDDDDDSRALRAGDDDAEGDDDGEADDLDDGERQSKNPFQKRLDRERRLKLSERRRAEEAERRANDLQRQLTDQRRSISAAEAESIKTQITNIEAQLEQAFEAGDSKKQVSLTRELAKLEAKQLQAESAPPAPVQQPQDNKQPTLAQNWMQKHRSWYNRPGFEKYSRTANQIDEQLFNDGYDVNDRKYYRELDKRLRTKFPEFFDDDRGSDSRRGGKRNTVAGVDGADNGNRKRALSGRVELGPDDLTVMRQFGLDPRDPAHLKEFASSRRERLLQEESEGRRR